MSEMNVGWLTAFWKEHRRFISRRRPTPHQSPCAFYNIPLPWLSLRCFVGH